MPAMANMRDAQACLGLKWLRQSLAGVGGLIKGTR